MPDLDDRAATRRLLDRFGFGALPGGLDAAVAQGFERTLDAVLAPPADPDPGLAATPAPVLAPVPSATRADPAAKAAQQQARQDGFRTLGAWWTDRMTAVRDALPERLTWFWHGHFATSEKKVNEPLAMLAQNEVFRRLGAGDFRVLARTMVTDPAMLVWLDGGSNRVGSPNENLGRELMELFTLGVGNYTETDVREAARALTGWTVDRSAASAAFAPRRHDPGAKTVLGTTAAYDAPGLVDMITARPESARFVAGRLWFRLVSATPPSPAVMGALVDAYGPRRDVTALLRAMATSAPFRDASTSLVKQPVEWSVGLMRAVGARSSTVEPTAKRTGPLRTHLTELGQIPFQPPSVGGWPAGTAWLTPSAGLSRLALAQAVVARATIPRGPSGANAQLDWARRVLGVDAWSPRSTDALRGVAGGDPRQVLTVAALTPEYVVST